MSTVEQIVGAARLRVATKKVFLTDDKTVFVTVREMTPKEKEAFNAVVFVTGEDGKPITVNDAGVLDPKGDSYKIQDGVDVRREYLRATMTPVEALDGILSDDVPESVRKDIYNAAREVNGITVDTALGN